MDSRTLSLYFEDYDPNDDGDNDDGDHDDDFHHLKMILTPMLYFHLLSSDYDDRVRMMMMVVMAVIVVMVDDDDVSEDHDDDTDDASPRVLLRSTLPQTRMLGLTMIIDPCRTCILPPYFLPGA